MLIASLGQKLHDIGCDMPPVLLLLVYGLAIAWSAWSVAWSKVAQMCCPYMLHGYPVALTAVLDS